MIDCVNSIRANSFKILKEIEDNKPFNSKHLENIEQTLSRLSALNKSVSDDKTLMFPTFSSNIE